VVTVPVADGLEPLGFIELSGAPALGSQALETAYRVLALAAAGALAIAVLAALVVGRSLTEPLQSLAAAATRMGQGDLAARADVRGTREARQLALQFNGMAGELQASFGALAAERDALRRFIADASHELRTPITALKTFNELLRSFPSPDPPRSAARSAGPRRRWKAHLVTASIEAPPWVEFLQESATQIERLERVTHQLLDLSRLDGGLIVLDVGRHDAGDILDSVAEGFHRLAYDAGVGLVVRAPSPPLTVACDRARLETGLSNLVENALKHTPRGGAIELGARIGAAEHPPRVGAAAAGGTAGGVGVPHGCELQLWVRDSGCGIEPDDQARIFERFYRGRGARGEGSGLGLAIVQSVAHAHGGFVTVQSRPGIGSTFTIGLPPAPPAAR
jgi:two-component system sensor histidine kinase BaeS